MLVKMQQAFAEDIYTKQLQSLEAYLGEETHGQTGFEVYCNNYYISLREALINTYPLVTKLIGEPYMHKVIDAYLRHYPPDSGDISVYGADMPQFLSLQPEIKAINFVKDIANYEYKLDQLGLQAYQKPQLDLNILSEIEPDLFPRLIFYVAPHINWLESRYPINQLIDQIENETLSTMPEQRPEQLVLYKQADHCRYRHPLTQSQWQLLNHFGHQQPLATLSSALASELPILLQHFVQNGWLTGYSLQGEN